MTVLVTGIDGFVGSHLARHLLETSSDPIVGIVRDPAQATSIAGLRERLTLHQADINDRDAILGIVRTCRPGRIFHLAGQAYVPEAVKNPLETFTTNIVGSLHLLEAVRVEAPEAAVLVISSGEVYGIVAPEAMPIREDRPLNPHTPYAASKACLDLLAGQYRETFGLNVVVARAFNQLGPGQNESFAGSSFAKQIVELRAGRGKGKIMVGNLNSGRDFTDVRDVVRAYDLLLERRLDHGIFNVCTGRAVSMDDLLQKLIGLSGVSVDIVSDPRRFRSIDNPMMIGDPTRLKSSTGWSPAIPLEQTLADLLAYWERRLSG